MKDCLAFNDTGDVSDSAFWEAFKVVIRGFVLSFEAAQKKKQRRRQLSAIDPELALFEKKYREAPSSSSLKENVNLKHEYNSTLSAN